MRGYFKISRHYKWALDQVFLANSFDAVIINEDDLNIAVDFFDFFAAMYNVLAADPTLFCVSAWNDNGKSSVIDKSRPGKTFLYSKSCLFLAIINFFFTRIGASDWLFPRSGLDAASLGVDGVARQVARGVLGRLAARSHATQRSRVPTSGDLAHRNGRRIRTQRRQSVSLIPLLISWF